jgi:aspartyl-tRNA(Asn)/glutamyl-tRNA(Gln) amidotransferase subunit B
MQVIDDAALRMVFDAVYEETGDGKRAVSLVLTQLLGFLNATNKTVAEGPSAKAMLELVEAIETGTISGNAGKDVMEKMVATGKSAKEIIAAEGMQQISDDSAIEELVKKAIAANPKAIESWKAGKVAALGTIIGWVMKESKGQANPGKVQVMLQKLLR